MHLLIFLDDDLCFLISEGQEFDVDDQNHELKNLSYRIEIFLQKSPKMIKLYFKQKTPQKLHVNVIFAEDKCLTFGINRD